MEKIIITIKRHKVYEDVYKTTDYIASRLSGDISSEAMNDVVATDIELNEFSRFWEEMCVTTTSSLKEMVDSRSSEDSEDFSLTLNVSRNFDKALKANISSTIHNAFISGIIGKWYAITSPELAANYLTECGALLQDADKQLYTRMTIPSPR